MSDQKPTAGQWAEQQKKGVEKQEGIRQRGTAKPKQGGAREPATSDLEPEKDGGIAGP